jgi:4-hydroxy-tetrahydrodipicolinate reductase
MVGKGKMAQAVIENLPKGYILKNIFDSKNQVSLEKLEKTNSQFLIDCSLGHIFLENLEIYLKAKQKIVVVASNWYQEIDKVKAKVKKYKGCLLYSQNFSIANFYYKMIIQEACKMFNKQENYDLALVEEHHYFKKDYPSAVAKEIAEIVLKNVDRKKEFVADPVSQPKLETFYCSSLRHGKNTIRHNFYISGEFDEIEIKHNVRDRKVFTEGIFKALEFLKKKEQGFFDMQDLLRF